MPILRLLIAILIVSGLTAPCVQAAEPAEKQFSPEQIEFFEKQIQPLLKNRCQKCHGFEAKIRGNLKLTSRAAVLHGGELGPAVSLEKPDESLLLQAINYQGLEMPPTGKLPQAEIDLLSRWVKLGIPWTPGAEPVVEKPKHKALVVDAAARNYWAYRPVVRPAAPAAKNKAWISNPIDAFLLARLEAAGLQPVEPADPVALVRRAYYDLTGLPPTPAEVDAFAADPSAKAYEELLDRLLASPQYGEKWGRYWLDLVRFAETHGYERDNPKPAAWRYRDYVIDSFNADKPYSTFLREQLAGDVLEPTSPEALVATGYYRLGIWDDEPADRLLARYDDLDGVVSTTSQVMLGMTVGCARCHDHKKDPIPQTDYYRLLAFFRDITDMNGRNIRRVQTGDEQKAAAEAQQKKQQREGELYSEIYKLDQQFKLALARQQPPLADLPTSDVPTSDLVDLTYRFYRDTWETLPEFDSLKHEDAGPIAHNFITLDPASRKEAIGLVFEGKLKTPSAGKYTFDLQSTDGARLIVAGQTVIHKPARGTHQAEAAADLPAGLLPIRLEYFNTYNPPKLTVGWKGPDFARRSLTADEARQESTPLVADSRKKEHNWSYTVEEPAADWMQPQFNARGWKRGPGGFGTRGTPGSVVRTQWNTNDIWLRTSFTLESLPKALSLVVHHDEDVEVYLNGTRIFEAKKFLTDYQTVALPADAARLVVAGRNMLAVHCRQTGGGQYIDVGLMTGQPQVDAAELIRRHGPTTWDAALAKRYFELTAELDASRKAKPAEPGIEIMCVEEQGRQPTHVLLRGNPNLVGPRVEAGYPVVLCSDAATADAATPSPSTPASAGKRLALADWIADKSNPLTARVFMNRLWQFHFGRGIVPTPNDFGLLGEQPTHPELLNWLASEFMAGDWRIKRMHKLMMLSSAYRMSSNGQAEGLVLDPANHLYWRFAVRRLTAEELRDSILAVSGQLNLKPGGPGIYPPIPQAVLAGQSRPGSGWGNSPPEEAARRSVYIHVKRSLIVPILLTHDLADTDSSCAVRHTTTVPTQALGMLNGHFTNEQAALLAARLSRESPGDLPAQIRRALRLTSGRTPHEDEVQQDLAFIAELRTRHQLSEQNALIKYCLLTLNTNAFVYLD